MSEPWLTIQELADELRVSVRTVQRLNPPSMQVGGQKRFYLSEVERFLRAGQSAKGVADNVVVLMERLPRGDRAA